MENPLIKIVVDDFPLKIECIECGKPFVLWFNGGELDSQSCCGLRYSLEHGEIFLTVSE